MATTPIARPRNSARTAVVASTGASANGCWSDTGEDLVLYLALNDDRADVEVVGNLFEILR